MRDKVALHSNGCQFPHYTLASLRSLSERALDESPFAEIAHPQQRAFVAAFQETGNVRLACQVAKVGRSTHYRWLKEDREYREAVAMAKECAYVPHAR